MTGAGAVGMWLMRSVACVLLLGVSALGLAACGDGEHFAGYWRMRPPTDSPPRLLYVLRASHGYTIQGLWPYSEFLTTRKGDRLVWLPPGKGEGRLEFAFDEGGVLIGRIFASRSATEAMSTFQMTRATEPRAVLEAEMRSVAAHYTNPMLRSEIQELGGSLEQWAKEHGGRFPPVADLRADGSFWRWWGAGRRTFMNPVSREPMKLGDGAGDFDYSTSNERREIRLVGHAADGSSYAYRP